MQRRLLLPTLFVAALFVVSWAAAAPVDSLTESKVLSPSPRRIELRPAQVFEPHQTVCALAADRLRIAIASGDCLSPKVSIWSPPTDGVERLRRACSAALFDKLALARDSVVFTCAHGETDLTTYAEVHVATSRRDTTVDFQVVHKGDVSNPRSEGSTLGDLRGRDQLIVFGRWPINDGARVHEQVRRVLRNDTSAVNAPEGLRPVAGDGERLALQRSDGRVLVVHADGVVVSTIPAGQRLIGAAFAGSDLVLARGQHLDLIDIATGRQRGRWNVIAGVDLVASGSVAAWTFSGGIHLFDLARGREYLVRPRDSAAPFSVQVVPEGLYYSWSAPRSHAPGSVAFVPRAEVELAFG
jgi:hypothetical protein